MSPKEIKKKCFTSADDTHNSPAAADLNAQSVIEGLRQLRECPLAGYLKTHDQPFSFRSRISPTSAGLALPLESFITWPLSELSAATLPAL